jgi:hypothetical protein
LSWLTAISDTAKSGAELLPPQPARTNAESEMKDRKNLDGICWQAMSEMDKRFYEETNLIDAIWNCPSSNGLRQMG